MDARIVLYPRKTDWFDIPKPAIRPYPSRYAGEVVLKDGTKLTLRPIRPEDEPQLVRFHATLSEQSVYRRYFYLMNLESRVRHERLTRMCFIDYDRQMAFVAENQGEIIGVGRLIKHPFQKEAEIAVVVSDAQQRRGIGSELMNRLTDFARNEGLDMLTASVLVDNGPMRRLLERHGFIFRMGDDIDLLEGKLRI